MNNNQKKNLKTTKDKKKKKYKFKIRRLKKLFAFILIVTAVVLFARSSLFIVDNIKVTGNKKYQANEIILRSGLVTGQNVFKMLGEKPKNLLTFKFGDKEKAVSMTMPYISSISIMPSLPKSIKIKVTERTPFCILNVKGTSLLIDKQGYALEVLTNKNEKKRYFEIIGNSLDSFKLGQDVKFKNKDTLNDLMGFCNALSKNDKDSKLKLYSKLTAVNMSDPGAVTAVFENRVTVKFGDMDDLDYKIGFFRQLFVNNITAKQKGTLDFTTGSHPFFAPAE